MIRKIFLTMLVLISMGGAVIFAADTEPDFVKIMESLDMQSNFEDIDFSSQMTIITEDPEDGMSKEVSNQFRNDDNDEMMMITLEPVSQKGQGMLKVGDNVWMYDPESRKFTHMSMKENYGDSDAKMNDFGATSYSEDYLIELLGKMP